VSTYREIARSKIVTNQVIEKLNLNYEYKDLREKVDVTLLGDTEIIEIKVRNNSAIMAAMIANETALIFTENINRLMPIDNIQIIDKAEVPVLPVSPIMIQNMAIGFILAFMLAVLFIILLAYMNNKILVQEDITNYIGAPVIGAIPKQAKAKNADNNQPKEIITNEDPKSQYVEAYRTLRTNVQFLSANKESKCFVITSTMANEGKSTIATNLAYVMAQTNKRVLLIDGDLRKPMLAKIFKLPEDCGLTNVLVADLELEKAVCEIEDSGFSVMPAGPIPPNPSELLLSEKMEGLIQSFRNDYELILIDTPPLGLVTDSADLAAIADGVIIVCSSGETKIDNCKKVKQTLEHLNIKIMGIVLNKLKTKKSSYYKSGYY
jgi:capsular exopolysaccharide synthesis family protein